MEGLNHADPFCCRPGCLTGRTRRRLALLLVLGAVVYEGMIACSIPGARQETLHSPKAPDHTALTVRELPDTTIAHFDTSSCTRTLGGGPLRVMIGSSERPDLTIDVGFYDFHGAGRYTDLNLDYELPHGTSFAIAGTGAAGVRARQPYGGAVEVIPDGGDIGGRLDVSFLLFHGPGNDMGNGYAAGVWRCNLHTSTPPRPPAPGQTPNPLAP